MIVSELIERLYRQFLYPADAQPVIAELVADVANDGETFKLHRFAVPEDESLLRRGVLIEVEREIVRVREYDTASTDLMVRRGEMGTLPVEHLAGARSVLSPAFPWVTVWEAVLDNISQLYPSLYTVRTELLPGVGGRIYPIDDDLAVEVVEAWPDLGPTDDSLDARIVDYHPEAGGRAVVSNVGMFGDLWVKYRRRFAASADPETELADMGVDDRWLDIVLVGAAADLMAGKDIPATQIDWVGKALAAEAVPVGSRASVSVGLARYRAIIMERARREMRAEYRATVHQRRTSQVKVRSAWG